ANRAAWVVLVACPQHVRQARPRNLEHSHAIPANAPCYWSRRHMLGRCDRDRAVGGPAITPERMRFRRALLTNSVIYLHLRALLLPQCFQTPVPNIIAKMATPPSL